MLMKLTVTYLDAKDENPFSTWGVAKKLGLVCSERDISKNSVIVYGSSDPEPNPAELCLTQLVASLYKLDWMFFTYRYGKNLPMSVEKNCLNSNFSKFSFSKFIFDLEEIAGSYQISLRRLAEDVFILRKEPVIIARFPDGQPIRATFKIKDVPDISVTELHEMGGWLGGSGIHFLLRRLAEEWPDVVFLCPFQNRGKVYQVYNGVTRPLFVTTPFVRFLPPSHLELPSWAPTPWEYWFSLPACFRRRVRKNVQKILVLFPQSTRIEVEIP